MAETPPARLSEKKARRRVAACAILLFVVPGDVVVVPERKRGDGDQVSLGAAGTVSVCVRAAEVWAYRSLGRVG